MLFKRRIPRTTNQIDLALARLVRKVDQTPENGLALNEGHILELLDFDDRFRSRAEAMRDAKERQMQIVKQNRDTFPVLRTHVRQYFQNLNYLIRAGLANASERKRFGIAAEDGTLPEIKSMDQLIMWGSRVWKGEQKRVGLGGHAVTMPSPQELDIRIKAFAGHVALSVKRDHDYTLERLEMQKLRTEGSRLMTRLYANIWFYFSHQDMPVELIREECRKYGMIFTNTETGEVLEDENVEPDTDQSESSPDQLRSAPLNQEPPERVDLPDERVQVPKTIPQQLPQRVSNVGQQDISDDHDDPEFIDDPDLDHNFPAMEDLRKMDMDEVDFKSYFGE